MDTDPVGYARVLPNPDPNLHFANIRDTTLFSAKFNTGSVLKISSSLFIVECQLIKKIQYRKKKVSKLKIRYSFKDKQRTNRYSFLYRVGVSPL